MFISKDRQDGVDVGVFPISFELQWSVPYQQCGTKTQAEFYGIP